MTFVLFPDLAVHFNTLDFLVLNEVIKLLVNRLLKLLMVISVLDHPVNGILLLVDLVSVLADDGTILGNLISH